MLLKYIAILVVMMLKKEFKIIHVDVKMVGGMIKVNVDLVYLPVLLVLLKLSVLGVIVTTQDFMLILMVYVKLVIIPV